VKRWFWFSFTSFFISSAAILLMPYGSFEPDGNRQLAFSLAGVFWLFFVLGFLFLIPIGKQRRNDRRYLYYSGFPFFRFFSNKPAVFFDVLLIAGIVTLAVSLFVIRTLPGWVTLTGTFATVLSLKMHGLFNGKNYSYLYH